MNDIFDFWTGFGSALVHDQPYKRKDVRKVFYRQIFYTGAQAFKLIAIAAIVLGLMVVAQSAPQLQKWGGTRVLGGLLVGALLRELGPLITVIIVVSRSVAAMASELSSMKANGEIDTLKGIGVSPMSYLVVPRVLAGGIATLFLAMHFVWIAFLVGFVFAQVFVSIPFTQFWEDLLQALTLADLFIFTVKTLGLGFLVMGLACSSGLRVRGDSFEIPVATTRAVVSSFIFALLFQLVISSIFYFQMASRSQWGLIL